MKAKSMFILLSVWSRMGVAIGVEAAHLLHFPNLPGQEHKVSLPSLMKCRPEINFFVDDTAIGWDIVYHYYDMSKDERHEICPSTRFKGKCRLSGCGIRIYQRPCGNSCIQNLIKEWYMTQAKYWRLPSASIISKHGNGIISAGRCIWWNIPVCPSETSSALLNMLNSKKRSDS